MKRLIAFLVLVFIGNFNVNGQETQNEKEKLLEDMATETCDCISQKYSDFSKVDMNTLQLDLGLCIVQSYTTHQTVADALLKVSLDDDSSMEYLGQQVGLKMFPHCPDVIMAFADMDQTDGQVQATDEDTAITGHIVAIEKNQFNVIEFKDNANRVHKLLWLEYFPGEDLLRSNNNFENVSYKVSYYESELFDPVIMEYRNFKVITHLSML